MSTNGITELTDTQVNAPAPEIVSGHRIDPNDGGISTVGSVGISKPAIVELNGSNQGAVEFTEGKPLTEDEKPIVKPAAEDMLNPNDPFDLGSIPGVKEVSMREIPDERPQPFNVQDMKTPDGKPLTASANAFVREMLKGGFINQFIKKYDLGGIDLEAEAARIQEKKSNLSASRRKAVMALIEMRRQQQELLKLIGNDLKAKDSIDNMNQEDAKETAGIPGTVTEAMEAAKVEYTPGESSEEEGAIKLEVHE